MQNETKLYGIIAGHEHISFILDDFQCVFINSNFESKEWEIIPQEQGYILGKTTEGKYVYIYSNKDLKIHREMTLSTWLYFVSSYPDIEKYQALSFEGGILDKLFFKSIWENEYEEPMQRRITYSRDEEIYPLTDEKLKGHLSVGSGICDGVSVEKGSYITTTGTKLELVFEEERGLYTFPEIYGYILNLCQFMAFRRNIRFEEILLKRQSEDYPEFNEEIAKCYVRYEEGLETKKYIFECITFNTLGKCVDNLLSSIVNNEPKKPRFHIGFIPENDKDVNYITNIKVREICSALESEMELLDIQVETEEEFKKLIKELKKVVKAHRDSGHPMTDTKSYDYIFGTLDHMTGALADRIEKCFMEYQPLMGEYISRSQIDELVNYRNTITHGSYMQLDASLAETAYVLMKLIYCCVLTRAGMEKAQIKELMKRKVIS